MKTFADQLIHFYLSLQPPKNLSGDIEVLFPQKESKVKEVTKIFFKKFFNDNKPRRLIFGINPGRFGAGTTGINFTGPKQLKGFCKIDHPFKNLSELSAEFIYKMITEYGGVKLFYNHWFISAVSPLGFIKEGKNINYYDDKKLMAAVVPFIIANIRKQIKMGFKTDYCLCVGGEKNFKFLSGLNKKYKWFRHIIPLPHPRFIMQYRRKQIGNYIQQYVSALRLVT